VTRIPYLSKQSIACRAEALLTAFGTAHGDVKMPPVPIEDVLECHLGISLGFDDLSERFGSNDILGAIWITRREVLIDQRLDPVEHASSEGRYRFTLAHEIGHWELHRDLLTDARQLGLPGDLTSTPSLICRKSEAKKPIEWQADRFAADLLMPAALVRNEWLKTVGNVNPLVYEDHKNTAFARRPHARGMTSVGTVMRHVTEKEHSYFFENVAREFAPRFCVSNQAMRIRLEDIGLLQIHREATLFA
jgi:hypothetical protein